MNPEVLERQWVIINFQTFFVINNIKKIDA